MRTAIGGLPGAYQSPYQLANPFGCIDDNMRFKEVIWQRGWKVKRPQVIAFQSFIVGGRESSITFYLMAIHHR